MYEHCLFCPDLKLVVSSALTGSITGVTTGHCASCKCSFYWGLDTPYASYGWRFSILYKENTYYVDWHPHTNLTAIEKLGSGVILAIRGETTLTPHNIMTRLPTLLNFS
jgi:hypothetical protein